jgi:hypothetical protein
MSAIEPGRADLLTDEHGVYSVAISWFDKDELRQISAIYRPDRLDESDDRPALSTDLDDIEKEIAETEKFRDAIDAFADPKESRRTS